MQATSEVHNQVGSGFLEGICEPALPLDLEEKGYGAERQKANPVFYKQLQIGEQRLDLVVEIKINLELKGVSQKNNLFSQQLLSCLRAPG